MHTSHLPKFIEIAKPKQNNQLLNARIYDFRSVQPRPVYRLILHATELLLALPAADTPQDLPPGVVCWWACFHVTPGSTELIPSVVGGY